LDIAGEASDGQEGVELYQQLKPDLVFLDVVMPRMSGIEALKQIRAIDPEAKVIMLTSMSDIDSVTECRKAGAIAYILKPFEADKIKQIVDKFKESLA